MRHRNVVRARSQRTLTRTIVVAVTLLALGAPAAWAQPNAQLTGRVEDETGGLMPGVGVLADCDCLLTPRETTTGPEGRFNLTALPVGEYTVTFSLSGFSTVVLEGLEARALVATTANATLAVGGVQETVTVSGTPRVDVINVREQRSQTLETLEALPTGARDYTGLGKALLGVSQGNTDRQDVGGAFAEINTGLSVHGSLGGQSRATYDGMNTNIQLFDGGGQMRIWKFNTISVQEITIDIGGGNADTATGGANINMIPRDGANVFSFHSFLTANPGGFGTSALPDSVVDRSNGQLTEALFHKRVWDLGLGVGGPIVRNRVWFYASGRDWGGESNAADNFFNKSTDFWRYEEDRTRPAFTALWQKDYGSRFTIQAAPKHRLSQTVRWQQGCGCKLTTSLGDPSAPSAVAEFGYGTDRLGGGGGMWLSQTSWTAPVTNNLLFQAGVSSVLQEVFSSNSDPAPVGAGRIRIINPLAKRPIFNQNPVDGTVGTYEVGSPFDTHSYRASVAYVTGTHNFKIGVDGLFGRVDQAEGTPTREPISYLFFPTPVQITQYATPIISNMRTRSFAFFAQDHWTIDRMTLNLGLRYEYFHAFANPVTLGVPDPYTLSDGSVHQPFVQEVQSPGLKDIPKYHDISPRLGVVYDLQGDGKTALKASWGRYMMGMGAGVGRELDPATARIETLNRLWFDNGPVAAGAFGAPQTGNEVTGDYIPQCDLTVSAANGECGATIGVGVEDLRRPVSTNPWEGNTGWGNRAYSNQLSVGVQRALTRSVSLSVSYFRNSWHNTQYNWNRALTAADFAVGSITAPTDSRLGDRSGAVITGIFDRNVDSLGRNEIVRIPWQDIPGSGDGPKFLYNGVDIALDVSLMNGVYVAGGVTIGRRVNDECWANNLPQVSGGEASGTFTPGASSLDPGTNAATGIPFATIRNDDYCRSAPSIWNSQSTQIKFQALYPLPQDFMLSGNFYTSPGVDIGAELFVPNVDLEPSLGRPLTGCAGLSGAACPVTAEVNLIPNQTRQDDRITQLDLKLSRAIIIGGLRLIAAGEVYNVFNSRPVLGSRQVFDATYLSPQGILGGRFFKWTATLDW